MRPNRALPVVVALGLAAGACGPGKAPATPQPFPRPAAAAPVPAAAGPSKVSSPAKPPASAQATLAEQILDSARAQLGVPYRFGGGEPGIGFDCSGLVQYVFEAHHVDLPRTVGEQYGRGIKVTIQDVHAGDLVFFSTTGPGPTHVGIALGNGEFIHAPASNGVVRIEHYDTPYWHDRLVGARRMF